MYFGIDLTKSKRKGFYIVAKDFYFNAVLLNVLFIKECWEKCVMILKKNIKQHNFFQHW